MASDARTQLSLTGTPGRRYAFNVNVAVSPVSVAWVVVAPAITLAVAAAPVAAAWTVVAPVLTIDVAPAPVVATWAAQTPGADLQRGVGPVAATWTVVAPVLTTDVAGSPIVATWTVVAPGLTLDAAPAPIVATWTVPPALGAIAAVASPISVTWSVNIPATSLGTTVPPVSVTWSLVPIASVGTVLSQSPVVASWTVVAPEVAAGLSVTPIAATWTVVAPGLTLDAAPAPVVATWTVVPPVPLGVLAVTPVSVTWSVSTVQVTIAAVPYPVAATWTVVAPALVTGLTVTPVSATWSVTTIAFGVVVTPTPVVATWTVVAPALVTGLAVTPVAATWSVSTPTTSFGVVVTPVSVTWSIAPIAGFGQSVDPSPVAATWTVVAPALATGLAVTPVSATWSVVAPEDYNRIETAAPLVLTWTTVQPTIVFSAIPPPQNNANTILLLHMNEPESTTARDLYDDAVGGTDAKTISAAGDSAIEVDPKFDYAALGMAANGSHLRIEPSADLDFAAENFTIDFHVKIRDVGRAHLLTIALAVAGKPDPDNRLSIELVNTQGPAAQFLLRYRLAGVDLIEMTSTSSVLVSMENTYKHVAIVRWGGLWTLYLGGSNYAQTTAVDTEDTEGQTLGLPIDVDMSAWSIYLGGSFRAGSDTFFTADALFDELRIQKTAAAGSGAVWQSDFIPPVSQYTRRFSSELRGNSAVYDTHQSVARGTYNLAAWHHSQQARGAAHVLNATSQPARGTSHVLNSYTAQARGMGNVIKRTFRAALSGVSAVKNAYSTTASGAGRVLTERFNSEIRGRSTVRERFTAVVSGMTRTLAAFAADIRGAHRTEDNTDDRYELFHALNAMPTMTAAPDATSATLPFNSPAISGEGKHYFVVRRRNRFGVVSGNMIPTIVELDGADNQIVVAPSAPEQVTAVAIEGDKLRVTAEYVYPADGALAGDGFAIYRSVGLFGSMDYVTTVPMVKVDGIARLIWESTETFDHDPVTAVVRIRRSSDSRDSDGVAGFVNFLLAVPVDPPAMVTAGPI